MNYFYKLQGDPLLVFTPDGVDFTGTNGITEMHQGIVNDIVISLLTDGVPKHINALFRNDSEKLGSEFQKVSKRPITVTSLLDRVNAAKKDLQHLIDNGRVNDIDISIENPSGDRINLTIAIDGFEYVLYNNENGWFLNVK